MLSSALVHHYPFRKTSQLPFLLIIKEKLIEKWIDEALDNIERDKSHVVSYNKVVLQ